MGPKTADVLPGNTPWQRATRGGKLAMPWLLGLVIALPTWLVHYPPMGDLGFHEGLAAILCHWHDPIWNPPGLYRVFIPQANQLFVLTVAALGFVMPTELAAKGVVGSILLLSMIGMFRLLRRLRLSPALAPLVSAIVCGWMYAWGLAPNLTGFVLFVFAIPSFEKYAENPTRRRVLVAFAWALVVFLGHESAAVCLSALIAILAVARAKNVVELVARLLPVLFVGALLAIQSEMQGMLMGSAMRGTGTAFDIPLLQRLSLLPSGLFGAANMKYHGVIAILSGIALGTSVCTRRFRKKAVSSRALPLGRRVRTVLLRNRYAFFSAALFALYLVFPMRFRGNTMVAFRFLPPAFVGLIVACSGKRSKVVSALVAAMVPCGIVLVQHNAMAKADLTYAAHDRILAHIEPGSSVVQLDWNARTKSRAASVFNDRVQAARGGRELFGFTDMPPNPVYIPPNLQWNEPLGRLSQNEFAFIPSHDFHRFEYVLAKCTPVDLAVQIALALAPEADLIARDGEWLLFRSHLPLWPLLGEDVPRPSPLPATLGQRLEAASKERTP